MSTKLVDKIFIENDNISAFIDKVAMDALAKEVQILLNKRWVLMSHDDLIYDNEIVACYLNPNKIKAVCIYNTDDIRDNFGNKYDFDLFTMEELEKAIFKQSTPFEKGDYGRPYFMKDSRTRIIYKIEDNVYSGYIDNDENGMNQSDVTKGVILPMFRLGSENSPILPPHEVLSLWIKNSLIPEKLKKNAFYISLLGSNIKFDANFNILSINTFFMSENDTLLNEDKKRADIFEYNEKMLSDTEQGHWSLWNTDPSNFKNPVEVNLKDSLVARDPVSSIVDGVVGIDFGTKSTVVVYQGDTTKIHPMRIGTGDLRKGVDKKHYENPTIMEFNNLKKFIEDYSKRDGRPYTDWQDITVSHTAFNSLMESSTDDFNSYIDELKQWAGTKNKKLKIVDKESYILDLEPFIELDEDHINPIELYAYYLGLYINNQHNGIFLNYILSFPVTYEIEIREKIIRSFEKGIKKSLPQELHFNKDIIDSLSVLSGASEPAAYAVVALQEYKFEPSGNEKIFYGVFDFGGGTTDFDFGIWREADHDKIKERRYDYVVEHFGAGGDRFLGGENILELIAFYVFKENKDALLKTDIQFILPPECEKFIGSETLLSNSREANMNMKTLSEVLRPFWERPEGYEDQYKDGLINLNLTSSKGQQLVKFELVFDPELISDILKSRIHKGVKNFFEQLRVAFSNQDVDINKIDKINIFLAGNSSKSDFVDTLFEEEIKKITEDMQKTQNLENSNIFELFPPLGSDDGFKKLEERGIAISNSLEQPTGKTGVAYGLIETRKGGDILVLDHNVKDDINFKYYLGECRKDIFKVIIGRDIQYNKWIEFIDAGVDQFDLYYTTQPLASTNNLSIDDSGIKKMIVKIDHVDENASVYIRVVDPTEIEYVVALSEQVSNEQYLSNITKIELD
ncbi:MAG: hypothetical protein B6229_04515 [Spirochaetaceae bacterium 4572_7]|nr:MAG: hypothetical protein B6229_04515 [Spirochaetaceae bacterium 4572_7]